MKRVPAVRNAGDHWLRAAPGPGLPHQALSSTESTALSQLRAGGGGVGNATSSVNLVLFSFIQVRITQWQATQTEEGSAELHEVFSAGR